MSDYIKGIKIKLRDQYGFTPSRVVAGEPCFDNIPDGVYPMRIDGRMDRVEIVNGSISCCHFGNNEKTKRKRNQMKKTVMTMVAVLMAATVGAWGQSQPSSKATAKASALTLLPKTTGTGGYKTVLTQQIKTANQKDLFVDVSFECGLFTKTTVNSKNLIPDTAEGQAEIDVRVLVDGREIDPGAVVFSKRTQVLSSTLEGAIGNCLVTVSNLDGSFSTTVDLACVQPETIELTLDSLEASSFNFIAEDLSSGVHTVSIQARIDTIGSSMQGSYSAMGLIGKGSVVIESVRMVRGEDVVDIP